MAAAFQPQSDPDLHLPCVFKPASPRSSRPSPRTGLFAALRGRLQQEDLLALLENPLIAAHFHLDEPGSAEEVLGWLQDANFRWGMSAEHRLASQGSDHPGGDLRFALRRWPGRERR